VLACIGTSSNEMKLYLTSSLQLVQITIFYFSYFSEVLGNIMIESSLASGNAIETQDSDFI
jgi:hypothetical protein